MPATKWSKDTPQHVRELAALVQQLSLDEAKLVMRLQVLQDVAAYVRQAYDRSGEATRQTMLTTLDMFAWFATEGHRICRALAQGREAGPLLNAFVQDCGRFGGRGGDPLMSLQGVFETAPGPLNTYLHRGLVDLVKRWAELPTTDRYAFVRAVLDIDKIYPNTIGASDRVVFDGAPSAIQRWRSGSGLGMADVLQRWLVLEANDSIYTGMAFTGGIRRTNAQQLAEYGQQAATRSGHHHCWLAILNAVALAKGLPMSNHETIRSFFAQNLPAIVDAFRPDVPEVSIRQFVEQDLLRLLANPVFKSELAASSSEVMRWKSGQLNKLKELGVMDTVKLDRAKDEQERVKVIEVLFKNREFTRRIDDVKVVFDFYDATAKEYVFKPASA